ncbi:hypothetical protein AN643_01950 [Candidatus Epulonipiscioides saccharophilum]|nr:hypothetical protein AN643_01950 [Epulopiscium sp. SCG-B10WGA-EpuloB]
MELLSPTIDFIFKKIFGDEHNKELLIDFLNATLRYETPIVDLKYEDTVMKKEYIDNKYSILDIRATLSNKVKVNVEIQVADTDNMLKRALYYWSQLYGADFKSGKSYKSLQGVICINILNYNLFEDIYMYHRFILYDDRLRIPYAEDLLELHFMELSKLDLKKRINKTNEFKTLINWLTFLKDPNLAKRKKLGGAIDKAMDILTELSGDEEVRKTYFERRRILLEEINALDTARDRGIQEGIQQGIQQNQVKTAIALLGILEDEVIALTTGLDIEVIRNLRKTHNK